MKPATGLLWLVVFVSLCFSTVVKSKCSKGCDVALASYWVWDKANLTFIGQVLGAEPDTIVSYNKDTVPSKDQVVSLMRINVPFSCDCIRGEFLGHQFLYNVSKGDTYTTVAETYYSNLTTIESLTHFNSPISPTNIPDTAQLKVIVNCSCGNSDISEEYGLFITYPLRPGETLQTVANNQSLDAQLLQRYNEGVNFSQGSGVVFIPGKGLLCFELMNFDAYMVHLKHSWVANL